MPCKRGDIVRLKNITMYYTADYEATYGDRGRIRFFDSTYTGIGEIKVNAMEGSDANPVYNSDGNIIQMTIPSWASLETIAYFGICAQDINENSIITVNEEIVD